MRDTTHNQAIAPDTTVADTAHAPTNNGNAQAAQLAAADRWIRDEMAAKAPDTPAEATKILSAMYKLPLANLRDQVSSADKMWLRTVISLSSSASSTTDNVPANFVTLNGRMVTKLLCAMSVEARAEFMDSSSAEADYYSDWITSESDRQAAVSLLNQIEPNGAQRLRASAGVDLVRTHGSPPDLSDINGLSLQELRAKQAAGEHTFSDTAALRAREMMLSQHDAVDRTGHGPYGGTQAGEIDGKGKRMDCTEYVVAVLGSAFEKAGQGDAWHKIMSNASADSHGDFKGTELLKSLEQMAGWKAVFWSPNPTHPSDNEGEHPAAYRKDVQTGAYYGIKTDNKPVVDYANDYKGADKSGATRLAALEKVPFAVITTRGGDHMALLIAGQLYECHWSEPSTSDHIIAVTPFAEWEWLSGVAVFPAESEKLIDQQ